MKHIQALIFATLSLTLVACGGGGGGGDSSDRNTPAVVNANKPEAEQAVETLQEELFENYSAPSSASLSGTWIELWAGRGDFTATYLNQSTAGDVIDEGYTVYQVVDSGITVNITLCTTGENIYATRTGDTLRHNGETIGTVEDDNATITGPTGRYTYEDTIDDVDIEEEGYFSSKWIKLSNTYPDTIATLDDSSASTNDLYCSEYSRYQYEAPEFSVDIGSLEAIGASVSESFESEDTVTITRVDGSVLVSEVGRTLELEFQ